MSIETHLQIISVTGAHSDIGKTTLASILLKNLKGFGAIKFTKTSLFTSVTDNTDIILEKNKDTAIMSESGAEKVFWIQGPADDIEDALSMAVYDMKGLKGIVIEGNSPANYLDPLLVIFIIGEDGRIKPSANELSKKADIIIINSKNKPADFPFPAGMFQENIKVFQIDLIDNTGEIDKFISFVKKSLEDHSN